MKKTISLALVFSFFFALAAQVPVLAEEPSANADTATSTIAVPVLTTIATTTATTTTGVAVTEVPKIEVPKVEATSTEVKASATSTIDKNLEKIPSPEYVKYFEKIRTIGKDLFGVRKAESEINRIKQEVAQIKNTETKSTSSLQKISSPEQMSLFEKITKIGKDLFGIKKSEIKATSTSENKTTALEKINSLNDVKLFREIRKVGNDLFGIRIKAAYVLPVMSAELVTCASSAIDTKDSKIGESFTAAATQIAAAITTRGTCQKAALALSSERQGAFNTCNRAFQEAQKKASDTAKNAQKEAWTAYTTSLKTCSQAANTSEIKLEDGGQNMVETLN